MSVSSASSASSAASSLGASEPSSRLDRHGLEAEAQADRERAEHIRTQFLRRVAHDIASPTGVTMTVLDEIANAADRPRPELLAMARRGLRRLMRLSEHLALAAELEGGELQPERAVTDLRTVAQRAFDEALIIDGRKDVLAAAELPDTPVLAAADARLLNFVVREVVGNAIKLASSQVLLTMLSLDGTVTLRVEDDGPGFSAEAMATLGRRFLKRTSARGLGLSISMAMEILRGHGGTLSVEASALPPGRRGGQGAAVVLMMPSQTDAAQPVATRA